MSMINYENWSISSTTNDAPSVIPPNHGMGASSAPSADHMSLAELTQNPLVDSVECPPLMSPIYDRVPHGQETIPNATTTKNNIPKIVHISYNTRCVPTEVFAEGVQRWKDELPDYSVYFHDDNAVDHLLQQDWPEFPDLHRVMQCIKYKGAMKVDLWRMVVIYEFGGIYTDIDNVPPPEFGNGAAIHPYDTFFASSDSYGRPNQNAFAMEPKHPIAVFTIQVILKNLLALESLRKPKVVFTTGPDAFKSGYLNYLSLTDPNLGKKPDYPGLKPGVYKGFMNKTVRKEPYWKWLNPVANEMVEYNERNMTKKERASIISNLHHWAKVAYWNRHGEDISCREYLYRLDHPSEDNLIMEKFKVLL